jgi:hypothetical protein
MKQNHIVLSLLLTVALLLGSTAIQAYKQKKITISGDYTHENTRIIFPESYDSYTREDITFFNKDRSDIEVSYYSDHLIKDPHFTVNIYPAPVAMEYRLKDEFFTRLHAITSAGNQEIKVKTSHLRISKDGYSVIGLSATIIEDNLKTVLVLFECGKYFLKYRISSKMVDTGEIKRISLKLIDRFSPIEIVKKQSLILGADIYVSQGCTTDPSCTLAIL